MEEKDKQAAGAADANQKSDKSPEELMSQVSESDGSLESSGPKMSSVDAMADESSGMQESATAAPPPRASGAKGLLGKVNIYLLLFIFLLVAGGAMFAVTFFMNKREQEIRLTTTELTQETLEELKTSDAIVGDPRQILTIESNAIITGKVVMRDTLDIAGGLTVGGPVSLPSISIAGSGTFGSLTTNDLQAAGNVAIGGILDVAGTVTIGQDLTVAGNITGNGRLDIGGQATIGGGLSVNGNITAKSIDFDSISINRLNLNGSTPSISTGGAAGGGATSSITGTDSAGTATINTGGGTGTGILATINFTGPFNSSNPHPVLTPNGSGCASINYYVTNISANAFAIATANAAPAGVACRFNYIVIN